MLHPVTVKRLLGNKLSTARRPIDVNIQMTDIEKRVMDALLKHKARPDHMHAIAKVCNISEVEASVAVQLLSDRNLIPPSDTIKQMLH
jgi:predicted transcriptional regulator